LGSQHAGGIVNHVFADAHVEAISDQIDPNVYLWTVTRNGGKPFAGDEVSGPFSVPSLKRGQE